MAHFININQRRHLADILVRTDGENLAYPHHNRLLKRMIAGKEIAFDAYTFFQVNFDVLEKLIGALQESVDSANVLFDLYCGVGIFGVCLQDKFSSVIGLEHARKSVQLANLNSGDAKDVRFFRGKVEEKFSSAYKRNRKEKNVIIVDPPRKGLTRGLLKDFLNVPDVHQLIYVSCDPSTLSRDLGFLLKEKKFEIQKVQMFDMFPRTKHFESVIYLKPLSE